MQPIKGFLLLIDLPFSFPMGVRLDPFAGAEVPSHDKTAATGEATTFQMQKGSFPAASNPSISPCE